MTPPPSAGLYLHVPFCLRKCAYCDFFSTAETNPWLANWHQLLCRHLALPTPRETRLTSLFFGGGTPSLLSVAQVDAVLKAVRQQFTLAPEVEISLEANPGTLDQAKLAGYRALGVNRLSLGVQSFNDEMLGFLGRIHSAEQARHAFDWARAAGFDNISLDLMFAVPGQKLADLHQDIAQLLVLNPEHVGIYGLSIEPGTPLQSLRAQDLIDEIAEETYVGFYHQIHTALGNAGYEHYEISNFARAGYRCRHNLGYWQRKTCLAAGAGAHGFDAAGNGLRYEIPADLDNYRRELEAGRDPAMLLEKFTPAQAMSETLYLGLRTADGIDSQEFRHQFGQRPEQVFARAFEHIAPWVESTTAGRHRLNLDGWLIYDQLIQHFLTR